MPLRVAIVGCGKIADQHVQAIRRVTGSSIVAACDREKLMADQLAERFGIPASFSDVTEMLAEARPDVVHVTTPPQSHLELGRACLEAGCHVYLEKPFTVTAEEAQLLVDLAVRRQRCLTAGHNYQFTPEMLAMRRLVGDGFLGGEPVHLESHWSYDLGDVSYVGPVLGSADHWVRRLPGQLLHNILSHGVARLAEFLDDDIVETTSSVHQSPKLRELGGKEVMDELRVLIRDAKGTTAYFCFSTRIKPGINQLLVCGPANSIIVDLGSGSVLKLPGRSYKSYLTFLVPSFRDAAANFANGWRNGVAIFRRRLYQDSGMGELIGRFHRSIEQGGPPPIPYREILLTARIMDRIFVQYRAAIAAGTTGEPAAH